MRWNRTILAVGFLVTVMAIANFIGCAKDKGTNPGGTVGLGTTLNLSLPMSGGSASFTFGTTAGTIPYRCGIHPQMTGNSVTIDASSVVDSVLVSVTPQAPSPPGFTPSSVTIRPGGTVRWVNNQGMNHTVVNQ